MSWLQKSKHPVLHSTKVIDGKTIEFRMTGEKNKYTAIDANGEIIRDGNGMAMMMSDEAIAKKGYPLCETSIVAFDGDDAIGWASDEWGSDGVWVVDEWQRKGIGTYLLSELRKNFKSDRKIGQMTAAGEQMARAYYRQQKNTRR